MAKAMKYRPETAEVTLENGAVVELTKLENRMLGALLPPHHTATWDHLCREVYEDQKDAAYLHALQILASRLRKTLELVIRCRRDVGYVLETDLEVERPSAGAPSHLT